MKKFFSWLKVIWAVVAALAAKAWAKVKTFKWNKLTWVKVEIAGAVLLFVATLIAVGAVKQKPQPVATTNKVTVKKVVENPTAKQIKKADAVITEKATIKASGTVKIKPKTTATVKESKTQYTIPLEGTANTTYTDSTGAAVGQGTHVVTGQANVTVTDNTATADVTINDTNQVAVVTEPAKKLKNEAGYFYDGDQQVFYKRNILTIGKKVELSPYIGGTLDIDDIDESRAEVGVRVRW